jgi:uncharacterized membrane protein
MRDESEQTVIHRLEAFSDIVIGFALAQLALTLTLPVHGARELFVHVKGATQLMGFAVTFALVCAVWWLHHKLFRHLFVPTRASIAMNFAALGGVIFLAYSLQVFLHFGFRDPVAFPMYTGSYGWVLFWFALIAWNGLRLRADRMNAMLRWDSLEYAIRLSVMTMYLLALTVAALLFGVGSSLSSWLTAGLVVVVIVWRILKRRLQPVSSPSA